MKTSLLQTAILSALVALGTACQPSNEFVVEGQLPASVQADSVILQSATNQWSAPVENGCFRLQGIVDSVQMVSLEYRGSNQPSALRMVLEPGQIEVTDLARGTLLNNRFADYQQQVRRIESDMEPLMRRYTDETLSEEERSEVYDQLLALSDSETLLAWQTVVANVQNLISVELCSLLRYGFEDKADSICALANEMNLRFPNRKEVTYLIERFSLVANTSVGKPIVDFCMNDLKGQPQQLSTLVAKNRYTLIDFWASWCPPCRREMPHVKDLYESYRDKGFGIVGVSLDNRQEAWEKGVKDLGIEWPQLSDLKGWQNEAAKVYGVNSIPHMILVDATGTIVARGLTAKSLAEKLHDYLGAL